MGLSDDVLCMFSAEIDKQADSYVISVPDRELTLGDLTQETSYGVAIFSHSAPQTTPVNETTLTRERERPKPPVEVGDHQTVDIEDIGEEGDGIARVERGYVVVVPETELNERVEIEITDVTPTVAFGEVIGREEYYQ
jgi:predicted RNA-binding protein with TRAM domain